MTSLLTRFSVVSHYKRDGYVVARVCLISDTEQQLDAHHEEKLTTFYHVMVLSSQLGNVPALSEGYGGPDGPGWIWHGLNCMTHLRDREVTHEVLSGTSVESRYQLLIHMFNISD